MAAKITLADAQRIAASRGGECLSGAYLPGVHLQWRCAQGHVWRATYASVRQGSWCPACARANRRCTLEEMQALAAARGGRCLSVRYTDCHTPLEWECALGHRWKALPTDIKHSGAWCRKCAQRRNAHTIGEMQEIARARDGQCLSRVYTNNLTALKWRCAMGHCWKATPNRVIQGAWCRQCANDKKRYTLERMQALAASRGGRCLSERYINTKTHLMWECARGHAWKAIPHSVLNGSWCPQCAVLDRTRDPKKRRKYRASCASGE